jgi:hypothetical protein
MVTFRTVWEDQISFHHEMGHVFFSSKNTEIMLVSKTLTCLGEKWSQKAKNKKKWVCKQNLAKSHMFQYVCFNFFGSILALSKLKFLIEYNILHFLNNLYDLPGI